jgi:hypothetical protein
MYSKTWQDRGVNPSQEPVRPDQPGPPPTDPTAEPVGFRAPDPSPGQVPGPDDVTGQAARGGHGPGTATGPGQWPGPPASGGHPGMPSGGGYGPGAASSPGYGSGAAPGPAYGPGPAPGPDPAYGRAGSGPEGPDPSYGRAGSGPEGPGDGAGFGLAHPSGPEFAHGDEPAWGPPRTVRRPWRRTVLVSVLTALVIFVLGGPLGLLWAWIAPGVPVIDSGGPSGIVVNDPSPEEYIAADGWFTLLGLAFGLIVAILAWLVLRRDRGPFLLLGVVAGTLGAGYLVAPWVGEMIGRSDYQQWKEAASQGSTYLAPPEVHSLGPMLVPAFIAAVVLTLLAGWSNDPDLEQPGARPGYGPNSEAGWAPGSPETSASGIPDYRPGDEVSESHAGVGYRPEGSGPAPQGPYEPPRA